MLWLNGVGLYLYQAEQAPHQHTETDPLVNSV